MRHFLENLKREKNMKFVNDVNKPMDTTTKRVLFVCTVIIVMTIGYFVYVDMVIEMKQYKDEIISIGPPGVTNVIPVFVVVLICSFLCCIILKLSNKSKWRKT